tara:strand:+ start:49 stop:588 length:540 start_codon:yes stop_codon:yes gene_type:complete
MRKRRGDSILLSQPEGVRKAIYRLESEEGLTLDEIRLRLAMPIVEGGFELEASNGTISQFLRHMRTEAFRSRLQERAAMAAGIEDAITDEDRARMDSGILDGLREWILDSVSQRELTAKDAKALVGLILKDRAQTFDERKLALLEKKAAKLDEIENDLTANDGLTPEERLAKIREGLKV